MKRKKSYAGFIFLFTIIAIFALFIWYVTQPSKIGIAKQELKSINDIQGLKANWDKYVAFQNNEDYTEKVREKAKQLISGNNDLLEVKKWLPARQTILNFVVVPDLSNRIRTIQGQFQKDTAIIHHIWSEFVRISSIYDDKVANNKFTVDLTDRNQAGGAIQTIADNLITDISKKTSNEPTRKYLQSISVQKLQLMDSIYQIALNNPNSGADYWEFFEKRVNNSISKSTLDIDYKNMVFLITDGYLETNQRNYTSCNVAYNDFNSNNLTNSFEQSKFFIPKCPSVDLTNSNICILEVRERDSGKFKDATILKMYWYYWFKNMNFKKEMTDFNFYESNDAIQNTKKNLSTFISRTTGK